MSTPPPPPSHATPQPPPAWQAAPHQPQGTYGEPHKGAPGAYYTSPIPITHTHLGHALASEWTKIKSVRSTMWTLGIFVVLVIGIGLITSLNTQDVDYRHVPYTIPAFFGLVLGQICLITLGVLVISSEYGTGMIRTTFTASPQRRHVLTAKFLVFFAVAYVVSAAAVGLVGLAVSGMHSGGSKVPWGSTVFMGALYVSLLGVLSLAVGSILRHSAGAITAMLGLVLVPAILPGFLLLSDSTRPVGELLSKYNAPSSLARIFHLDDSSNADLSTNQMLLLVTVTALAVGWAFVLLERRDV